MNKQLRFTIASMCVLVVLFGAVSVARAALIDNGNSMIDTATGMRWLDLTETQGLSWNGVEASTFVNVDGYVHATEAQVITLFSNAGFLTTDNTNNPANDPAANTLLLFLGCTQLCGTSHATGRGFAAWYGPFKTRPNYHLSGLGAGAVTTSLLSFNPNLIDTTAGHFLVQPVPVPPAAWLFCSSLLLIGRMRRGSGGSGR